MAGRGGKKGDPMKRAREIIFHNYPDGYEAFADMDTDHDGKISLQDFVGKVKELEWGDDISSDDLDIVYNACKVDQDGLVSLKDFLALLSAQSTSMVKFSGRPFEEVLMECKDEHGQQKFVSVPASVTWPELLQKLKKKYSRPVTFMYEADGKPYTVKSERDLKQCWDSVEEAFTKMNAGSGISAHLEAFIIDLDPSTFNTSTKVAPSSQKSASAARRSVLPPKRVSMKGDDMEEGERTKDATSRRMALMQDFESKHQWIDEMMKKIGGVEQEPVGLRDKWDRLLKACKKLDAKREGTVSHDTFRKALLTVEPNLTKQQIQWFINDADHSDNGRIPYERYCSQKIQGNAISQQNDMQELAVQDMEQKISEALKHRYKSLSTSFRKMDVDGDGFIVKSDLKHVIEDKLDIKIPNRMFEEVFKRIDSKGDGSIDYQEFIEHFHSTTEIKVDIDGTCDSMSVYDICKLLLNIYGSTVEAFRELNIGGNGRITRDELFEGLRRVGARMSLRRIDQIISEITNEQGKFINYKHFLKAMSTVKISDTRVVGQDESLKEEAMIRDAIRESFTDAKQAFHSFDKDKDGRLSQKEFFDGLDRIFQQEPLNNLMKNRLFKRTDLDGDGYLAYHEFLTRFGVKPVLRLTQGFERKVSEALRKHYSDSLHKAFVDMDEDKDGILRKEEFKHGTQKYLRMQDVRDEDIESLFQTAENRELILDFHEFVVRFGIDYKSEGRWVFTTDTKGREQHTVPERVKLFRRNMPPSKWYGRGGVMNILSNFCQRGTLRRKLVLLAERCQGLDSQGSGLIPVESFASAVTSVEPKFSQNIVQSLLQYAETKGMSVGSSMYYLKLIKHMEDENVFLEFMDVKTFGMALRSGLNMSSLTADEILLLSGKTESNSWWDRHVQAVNLHLFWKDFLMKDCKLELSLFRVLLSKNHWQEFKTAFESFDISSKTQTLISRTDFLLALDRLVADGVIDKTEKQDIWNITLRDDQFIKEGPSIGYIDFFHGFLNYYIPDEIELYQLIFPCWEECATKFEKLSHHTLPFRKFHDLTRQFHLEKPLSYQQVEYLIDVLDFNGDSRVSLDEFKMRFAREEMNLMEVFRHRWFHILQFLANKNIENKSNSLDIPKALFREWLAQAHEAGILQALQFRLEEKEVSRMGNDIPQACLNVNADVMATKWISRFCKEFYQVHSEFVGEHLQYQRPKWDVVISHFESLDKTENRQVHWATDGTCHVCSSRQCFWRERERSWVTWEEFVKTLLRSGVRLEPSNVQKLLEHLDPDLHGLVDWRCFVEGRLFMKDREGLHTYKSVSQGFEERDWMLTEPCSPPYFLDGKVFLRTRTVLTRHWRKIFDACSEENKRSMKKNEGKSSSNLKEGMLSLETFVEILRHVLTEAMEHDKDDREFLASLLLGLETLRENKFQRTFTVLSRSDSELAVIDDYLQSFSDRTSPRHLSLVDFVSFCKNFSQGTFGVHEIFEAKWQAIYSLFMKCDRSGLGCAAKSEMLDVLSAANLGLDASMLHFLIKDGADIWCHDESHGHEDPSSNINYDKLCWRFAKMTIQKKFHSKCLTMLKQFRKVDKEETLLVSQEQFARALSSGSLGFTQLEINLIWHFLPKTDERCRYHELLRGSFAIIPANPAVYELWLAIEARWEEVAEHFLSFDVNYDGEVSAQEFESGIVAVMKDGVLGEKFVQVERVKPAVQGVVREIVDPKEDRVNLDELIWTLAVPHVRKVLPARASQIYETISMECRDVLLRGVPASRSRGEAQETAVGKISRAVCEGTLKRIFEGSGLSSLCIRLIVNRMDPCFLAGERLSEGAITEESACKALREIVQDEVSEDEAAKFQLTLRSLLADFESLKWESWREKGEEHSAFKEFEGICVGQGSELVAKKETNRQHMKNVFSSPIDYLPLGLRSSHALEKLFEDRREKVYHSSAWQAFWLATAGGSERPMERNMRGNVEDLKRKVRKIFFLRFDSIESAFHSFDVDGNGLITEAEFTKGLNDLREGLSLQEITQLWQLEVPRWRTGGQDRANPSRRGSFLGYQDFLSKFCTEVAEVSGVAEMREKR